ncbi:uncharacterized protein LOC128392833 [Panonychus citri]|uniref:uncharacterized protein LOC128392833 n=1 Tax=Panonychus citri TaxID=50023 RepID=UPI002307110F|nr:uncharacterized protein LOC128392833 [Panonychus citri]
MLPCIYFLLITILSQNNLISGIPLDLPERNAYGEVHLISTLTNQLTGDVTSMEEYLSTKMYNERGKIKVNRSDQSYTIFYNENDDFRLVMTETDCQVYKYNERKWDKKLPFVDNELENILIMFGPTIYYRIQAMMIDTPVGKSPLIWFNGDSEIVRGIQMQTTRTTIENTLNVTVYRQGFYVTDEPYRVEFDGFLLETLSSSTGNQFLTIDFYLVESLTDLSYEVAPTPGIGCIEYLEKAKSFPKDEEMGLTNNFYFSAIETTDQGNEIFLKMFVDSPAKVVRYIVDYGGDLMETIYDYNLGISYSFASSQCTKSSMVDGDVGVINGKFNVKELLWQRGDFLYLGKFFYKHRSGIICDVWEKIDYNYEYEGSKYDKVVTTQYFLEKADISGFIPYNKKQTLISMTRTFYNLDSQKNYRLNQVLRRDIYDLVDSIPESEYQTLFQVYDCDTKNADKLWLIFEIVPTDFSRANEAIKTAEKNLIMLREGVRDNIIKSISMSPLRIANIEFDFSDQTINSRIMFIEKPTITDALVKLVKKVDRKLINPFTDEFKSLFDCVSKVAFYSNSKSIAWCKDNNQQLCSPVDDVKSLKSSGNDLISCEIYSHPVGDLRDLVNEFPLKSLHDVLINRSQNRPFMVGPMDDKSKMFKFQVTNVIYSDESEQSTESKLLFSKLFSEYKLKTNHEKVFPIDEPITTLGDCYHICESSEKIDCSGFSFCTNPKDRSKVSCQLTNHVFLISDDLKSREAIESDVDCDIYGKNHILDYVRISDREIISTGIGELTVTPDECASKCTNSVDCKSFSYCDNAICALSGNIYLTRLSKPNDNCNSYMLKRTDNFKLTGTNLVDGVVFVEEGVNLDQCATICFDYASGNDKCLSFNYCPKGRAQSTCQLSQSKLSPSKVNHYHQSSSNLSLTASGNCYHYELTDGSKMLLDPSNDQKVTTIITSAGGGLIAIIMLICLIVGFIYGFVGEYIYLRVNKQLPTTNYNSNSSNIQSATFSWSRQVDDDQQSTINN